MTLVLVRPFFLPEKAANEFLRAATISREHLKSDDDDEWLYPVKG